MPVTEKVKIDGGNGVTFVVDGADLSGVFTSVSAETGVKGDALVEKIIEMLPGRVEGVTRLQDGKREDGPGNTPAVRLFNEEGRVTLQAHYKSGVHTDVDGEPAFQQFDHETGRLVSQHHYINGVLNDTADEPAVMNALSGHSVSWQRYTKGRRNDGANGEPSIQTFTNAGVLMSQQRYKDGLIHDGVNGEPGYQTFNEKGRLVESFHCKEGQLEDSAGGRVRNLIRSKLHL